MHDIGSGRIDWEGAWFVGALAAYALTRLRMPHRNLIMSVLLAVAMFPLMVPLFKLMRLCRSAS